MLIAAASPCQDPSENEDEDSHLRVLCFFLVVTQDKCTAFQENPSSVFVT